MSATIISEVQPPVKLEEDVARRVAFGAGQINVCTTPRNVKSPFSIDFMSDGHPLFTYTTFHFDRATLEHLEESIAQVLRPPTCATCGVRVEPPILTRDAYETPADCEDCARSWEAMRKSADDDYTRADHELDEYKRRRDEQNATDTPEAES